MWTLITNIETVIGLGVVLGLCGAILYTFIDAIIH